MPRLTLAQDGPVEAAVVSPDGARSAWVAADGRSIMSATRAGRRGTWAAADRLLTIRGGVRNLVFSPDSKRIAFENPRSAGGSAATDRWGFIAVYDIDTRRISYVDPSFNIDLDPVWSGDGNSIAFTRTAEGLPDQRLTRPVARRMPGPWVAPPAQSSERFTLAEVMAAPFIYPPQSSGDGRSIAYATREATERNLYFLRIGEPARRIAHYPEDDGQEVSQLAVAGAGGAVAYVRGGPPNRQGDMPNPRTLPDPPHQQVWIVGTSGEAPRFVGLGSAPKFVPGDARLIWVSGDALMSVALTWEAGRLHAIGSPEAFFAGPMQGMRFSPDGSKLAYQRDDGIEIYDLSTRIATAVPHGGGSDQGPVWSPDSQRIVFRRLPKSSLGLSGRRWGIDSSCGNYRHCGPWVIDPPWSIWVVDVGELEPRRIWRADPGVGSIYYPLDQGLSPSQEGDELFWSADDRIAFAWEKDGWRHLYSVPVSGGQAALLTPGQGEVETVALSLDRSRLVYATNIGDLGRRHLASVAFDGSAPRKMTEGETSQWSPTPLADGGLAYIDAGWAAPMKVTIRDRAGVAVESELPRVPKGFPAAHLAKPRLVEFPASDGQTAYGQLFEPVDPKGCAIVFSHGGIRRQMLPGYHYLAAYSYMYGLNQYFASRGCVVLSVGYRSSLMRGQAFRNAPGWGFARNTELRDFVGAARYLKARPDVDGERGVGIYGLSWGGYMTAQLLAQHSDLFSVGFDMAGVHRSSNEAGYKYSAIGNLDAWTSPLFMAHGDDDRNVSISESIALVRALQAKRPNVDLVQRMVPDETHDLYLTYEGLVNVYREGSGFMLERLGVD